MNKRKSDASRGVICISGAERGLGGLIGGVTPVQGLMGANGEIPLTALGEMTEEDEWLLDSATDPVDAAPELSR